MNSNFIGIECMVECGIISVVYAGKHFSVTTAFVSTINLLIAYQEKLSILGFKYYWNLSVIGCVGKSKETKTKFLFYYLYI